MNDLDERGGVLQKGAEYAVALGEPAALWAEAPRYCADWPLPRYRFVAGLHPHPLRDPRGHSFGVSEPEFVPLPPERWRENRLYRFGVDLYHQGFFWEAHEVWERLWKAVDRHGAEGQFLQGLILLSAARIKLNAKSSHGVRKASWLGYRRLMGALERGASDESGRFMGIHLPDLIAHVERHYGAHWPDGSMRGIALRGAAPRMVLEE